MHKCLFCFLLNHEHSALAGRISISNLLRKSFPKIRSIPLGKLGRIAHCAVKSSVAKFSCMSTPSFAFAVLPSPRETISFRSYDLMDVCCRSGFARSFSTTCWLVKLMLAPVSIMHLAFCTPYRKDGMINCLFASFVGAASSLNAVSPWTGGWFARRLRGERAGGFCALCEPRVVAQRLAISFGTPSSSSSS
jgi:hypothetical protein